MLAVQNNGLSLKYADEHFGYNIHIVMEAVKQNGLALQYASFAAQYNSKIIMIAVKQNGLALKFTEHQLICSNDYINIVREAIKNTSFAIYYVAFKYQQLPEFNHIFDRHLNNENIY